MASARSGGAGGRGGRAARAALALFLAVLAVYTMTASGTIASSDGATMYLLARSVTLDHTIAIPAGNGYEGRDGRFYAKAGLGQAIVAAPFLVAAEAAAALVPRVVPMLAGREEFVRRAVTSLENVVAGAAGPALLALVLVTLGVRLDRALGLGAAFAFASPQWVYAKTFLTEPLTTACLLGGLLAALAARRAPARRAALFFALAGLAWGWAVVTKTAMAAAVGPLAAWAVLEVLGRRAVGPGGGHVGGASTGERRRLLAAFAAPLALCAALVLWYNWARFGSVWATGYGEETSARGFSTPLAVGLYGMLFSSGKSIFLYCPLLLLAVPGFALMLRRHGPEKPLGIALLAVVVANLLVYGRFMSWAGEGSWGPRYLVPFVGLCFAPIGIYLAGARRARHAVARALALAGVLVTLGGVLVYFGAFLRAAGEYPYTREFTDPRFMQETHFNPAFSPVVGHWRMALDAIGEHLAGRRPHVDPGAYAVDERSPLSDVQTSALLRGLDLWWMYLWYAGGSLALGLAAVAVLAAAAAAAGVWAFGLARAP